MPGIFHVILMTLLMVEPLKTSLRSYVLGIFKKQILLDLKIYILKPVSSKKEFFIAVVSILLEQLWVSQSKVASTLLVRHVLRLY